MGGGGGLVAGAERLKQHRQLSARLLGTADARPTLGEGHGDGCGAVHVDVQLASIRASARREPIPSPTMLRDFVAGRRRRDDERSSLPIARRARKPMGESLPPIARQRARRLQGMTSCAPGRRRLGLAISHLTLTSKSVSPARNRQDPVLVGMGPISNAIRLALAAPIRLRARLGPRPCAYQVAG